MKKYQYLASWDDQTLTRVGEPVIVLGDSNVSQVEVTLPSNFLLDPTKAECRMYFLLPGEKESNHDVLETAVKDDNGDSHVTWTIKHVHSQKGGRLAFSLTLIGDDAQWDSRTAIIPVYESRYQPESEEAEEPYTGRLTALEGSMASIRGEFAEVQDDFEELKETATLGTPIPESLVANMQEGHVYIYTGTEPGYTAGHVYYYVGGVLADGGQYGGIAIDDTLTSPTMAAPASEVGQIKEDLNVLEDKLIDGGIIADYLKPYLIGYSNINEDGSIRDTTGTQNQVYAVNVENRSSILASEANVYGYYSSKPTEGSVAMDGTRHFSRGVKPYIIDIPTGAKYVAIIVTSGTVPTFSVIDPRPLLSDKVAQIEDTTEVIENITDSIAYTEYTDSVSVLEDGTVTADYYFTMNGNNAGPYTGQWEYISFDVDAGEVYSVKAYAGQKARLWLLLNSNNGVVSYSQDSSLVSLKTETVTIPSGVTKMIVNAGNGGRDVSVNKLSTAIKVIPDAVQSNILAGKVLCCAGDSITYGADMDADGITNVSNIKVYNSDNAGNFTQTLSGIRKTWGYQIAERNGMTFYNAGVSGSTVQGLSDKNGFSLADGRYTKLPENIDYLVLWFGWNDTAYGTLGTINDDTNESYYGGYNVVLPYLINKYPYAKIALVVPFGTDADHRNAIRQLGNKWGVAVWDNYQGGTPLYYGKEDSVGVNQAVVTANRAKFQANGAHPNYKGHTQLGDMIEDFLRSI